MPLSTRNTPRELQLERTGTTRRLHADCKTAAPDRSTRRGQNMPQIGGPIGRRRLDFDVIADDGMVVRPAIRPPVILRRIAHLVSIRRHRSMR